MAKLSLLFILGTVLFFGCQNNTSDGVVIRDKTEFKAKLDSLRFFDSLVDIKKAADNKLAHKFADKALSLALSMNTEEALAKAFIIKGIAYKNYKSDSSFIFYSKALKIVDKNNFIHLKAKLYYNIAMVYLAAVDYKMAVIFLDSSVNNSRRWGEFPLLSNAYNALGNIKNSLLDTTEARIMFDSAYFIAKRNNLSSQMGVALASRTLFEKDPEITEKNWQDAIKLLSRHLGNEEQISLIQINLGLMKVNPDSAIAHYRSSLDVAKSGNFPELEIAAFNNMAYSLLEKNDFQGAENCLKDHAIPIAQRIEDFDWLSSLFDTYADVMLAQSKISKAFKYERQSLKMRLEANRKYANDQVRLLSVLLDVKNKELRIQSNESIIRMKENRIRLALFLFGCAILILLLTILFYSWRLQKNKIRYQDSLLKSANKLIDLEENQKGKISMELHDLANPFYIAIVKQIDLAKISDPLIERELKEKLSTLTEGIRAISHRIDNSFIGQIPLPDLIYGLTNDVQTISAVPIHFSCIDYQINLSYEKTMHVYRIIQEILFNAMKYVTSGKVEIELAVEENHLFVFYSDTGPGMESGFPVKKGLGISNIHERARILGGKAIMNSEVGSGTQWNISIPLK
ncbi:MAG: tetratricopeptide repeat-containing sensor histidine kinase [Alphaproteobacteria bacterium]|nr:tetratricopeptide repeat-containing sensor histidine kinase [Alphaproteobacteria bacterium]